ncbi:hypothetical protein C8Q73DRAFT_788952 [Cubamyces lactineus]|nr:hypothetical protein C8Q73DRAFT_788952 [Cubamyces lactineus]
MSSPSRYRSYASTSALTEKRADQVDWDGLVEFALWEEGSGHTSIDTDTDLSTAFDSPEFGSFHSTLFDAELPSCNNDAFEPPLHSSTTPELADTPELYLPESAPEAAISSNSEDYEDQVPLGSNRGAYGPEPVVQQQERETSAESEESFTMRAFEMLAQEHSQLDVAPSGSIWPAYFYPSYIPRPNLEHHLSCDIYALQTYPTPSTSYPQCIAPNVLSLSSASPTPPPVDPTPAEKGASTTPPEFEQGRSAHHVVDVLPETQPIAGPSRLPNPRQQPERAAKRKRGDHENDAIVEPSASRPKRQRRSTRRQASTPPVPGPSVDARPVRKRRTKAELEQAVMPTEHTRCSLGGCTFELSGDQAEARKHVRSHYPKAPKQNSGSKAKATAKGSKEMSEPAAKGVKAKSEAAPSMPLSSDASGSGEAAVDDGAKKPVICTWESEVHPGQQCGAGFDYVSHLSRHLEVVHYRWTFPCPACGDRLARRDLLQKHLREKCKGEPKEGQE